MIVRHTSLCRALLALSVASSVLSAQEPSIEPVGVTPPTKRILVLYSDERLIPANVAMDSAMRQRFALDSSFHLEIQPEYLDVQRLPGTVRSDMEREYLQARYRGRSPDLIISAGGPALLYLLKNRAVLFPHTPLVYMAVTDDELPASMPDDRIVGIRSIWPAAATIELVLRLQPETQRFVVINGASPRDLHFLADFNRQAAPFQREYPFTYLTGLTMAELRTRVAQLPDHTAIVFIAMFSDSAGTTYTPARALQLLQPSSRAPMYAYADPYLGRGIVGGAMAVFSDMGHAAGDIALEILHGAEPKAAARAEPLAPRPMVDWRELKRWNIPETRLPVGTIVRYRAPSLWEEHRQIVLAAGAAIIFQAVLIFLLLVERRARRRALAELRESEHLVRMASRAARGGVWILDVARDEIWATPEAREAASMPRDEKLTFSAYLASVEPADRAALREAIDHTLATRQPLEIEYRVRRADGSIRWIAARGQVEDEPGQGVRIVGAAGDITTSRNAELELQKERREIARLARAATAGHLSASITHELNQPLASILANAQAGMRLVSRENPDIAEIRDILADIAAQDQRAADVISRLRAHFASGSGRVELLNVANVVQRTVAIVRGESLMRHVAIAIETPDVLPMVSADRVHIEQVLLNLLLNAFESTEESARTDAAVTVRVSAPDSVVRIEVIDRGTGIRPEMRDRLFTPFSTSKRGGMGMGLAISLSLIEAQGGRLYGQNNDAGGATFAFELPAVESF